MKTKTSFIAATFAAALASVASAQINPNPSGVDLFNNPQFFQNNWNYFNAFGHGGAPNGNLYIDSGANVTPPAIVGWNNGIAPFPTFNPNGGTVKTIFLGETAGNNNDFGYVKFPNVGGIDDPANLNFLATDIENSLLGAGNISSGQEAYVHYGAGETVDFFLYNSGSPYVNGGLGAWFVLGDGMGGGLEAYLHGQALPGYQHYRWTMQSVWTRYVNDLGVEVEGYVDTLLVSFEDFTFAQTDPNEAPPIIIPGADYSDFIFAFQFLPNQAVPEPSTYGLMGAAALLGLVGYRRFKASKKKSA